MGQRGTEVAKEAARMVLRDDRFPTILEAMREGRVIFGNIRNFAVYLMSCNVSQLLVVGLAVGAGLPTPLLPLQILFLNVVTGVFPALALGLGPGSDAVLEDPPRDPDEPIVNRASWVDTAMLGAFLTVAILGAFVLALFWLELETGAAVHRGLPDAVAGASVERLQPARPQDRADSERRVAQPLCLGCDHDLPCADRLRAVAAGAFGAAQSWSRRHSPLWRLRPPPASCRSC